MMGLVHHFHILRRHCFVLHKTIIWLTELEFSFTTISIDEEINRIYFFRQLDCINKIVYL